MPFAKNYYVRKRQLIIMHPNKYSDKKYICDGRHGAEYIPSFSSKEKAEEYIAKQLKYVSETRPDIIPENISPAWPTEAIEKGIGGIMYKGPVENSVICEIYSTYARCLGYGLNQVVKRKKEPLFTVYENYVIFEGFFPYTEENLELNKRAEV